jgi:hypothetical protein
MIKKILMQGDGAGAGIPQTKNFATAIRHVSGCLIAIVHHGCPSDIRNKISLDGIRENSGRANFDSIGCSGQDRGVLIARRERGGRLFS